MGKHITRSLCFLLPLLLAAVLLGLLFRPKNNTASGGMLELHGRLHGVSSAEANRQIREALGKGEYRTDYQVVHAELFFKTGECSSGRRNRGRCNRETEDI